MKPGISTGVPAMPSPSGRIAPHGGRIAALSPTAAVMKSDSASCRPRAKKRMRVLRSTRPDPDSSQAPCQSSCPTVRPIPSGRRANRVCPSAVPERREPGVPLRTTASTSRETNAPLSEQIDTTQVSQLLQNATGSQCFTKKV